MARSFNGTTDLIDINSMPAGDTSPNINLGCWINTSTIAGALMCSDGGSGTGRVIQFRVSANVVNFILFTTGSAHSLSGSVTVTGGVWHHVVGAFDGTTMRLYVDGSPDGTLTTGANGTLATKHFRIGAQISGVTQQLYAGSMAHAFIRYSALSANEVKSLANGMLPSHLGVDHYWPLWGMDSPEPDIGNSSHATDVLSGTSFATDQAHEAVSLLQLTT